MQYTYTYVKILRTLDLNLVRYTDITPFSGAYLITNMNTECTYVGIFLVGELELKVHTYASKNRLEINIIYSSLDAVQSGNWSPEMPHQKHSFTPPAPVLFLLLQHAPKERRRRRAGKRSSKKAFLEIPVSSLPPLGFALITPQSLRID